MWATGRIFEIAAAYATAPGMTADTLRAHVLAEAQALAEEDVEINTAIAVHGNEIVPQGANILHHWCVHNIAGVCWQLSRVHASARHRHVAPLPLTDRALQPSTFHLPQCSNTGALATVDVGTALGVIYQSHRAGKGVHVWVDETRPRLQGAKLTAWELMRGGVPMHLIADNAAGHLMQRGRVQLVLFGADRVASNGDVANKIGTYKLCVVARENGIPAFACVPTSTVDLTMASGDEIHIEERSAEEVTHIDGVCIAPVGVPVFNPAFDVTPFKYLTGIITEEGICYPPFEVSLRDAKLKAEKRRADTWQAKLAAINAAAAAAAGQH